MSNFHIIAKNGLAIWHFENASRDTKKSINSHSKTRTSSSLSLFPISAQRRFNKWMICPSECWNWNCILISCLSTHRLDVHLHLQNRTNTKFAIVCVHGILHAANFNRDIFMNNMKRKPQTYVQIHTWTISLRSLFSGSNSTISSSSIDQVHDSLHRICSKQTHRSVGRWVEICLERCLFTMQKWSSACARDSSWVSRNVGVCMHVFGSLSIASATELRWEPLKLSQCTKPRNFFMLCQLLMLHRRCWRTVSIFIFAPLLLLLLPLFFVDFSCFVDFLFRESTDLSMLY